MVELDDPENEAKRMVNDPVSGAKTVGWTALGAGVLSAALLAGVRVIGNPLSSLLQSGSSTVQETVNDATESVTGRNI